MESRKKASLSAWPLLLILALAWLMAGCTAKTTAPVSSDKTDQAADKPALYQRPATVTAEQAKQLLEEGNKRFVSGSILSKDLTQSRRENLDKNGQKPFAVVLTCSDSRVPPELIFDQALGDLFVIRVAGNIVDPVAMGSIEYGAEHLGAPVILILGHSHCGAVKASVDGGEAPGSIGSIVSKIKPLVDKAKSGGATGDALYQKVEDENIAAVAAEVEKSPVIEHLISQKKVAIITGKYDIGSGAVTFAEEKK